MQRNRQEIITVKLFAMPHKKAYASFTEMEQLQTENEELKHSCDICPGKLLRI